MKAGRLLLVTMLAVAAAACSRRQEPQTQQPAPERVQPDTAGEGARNAAERERMRLDSIARAREAASAEERRRAAETTARARAVLEEMVHFEYDEATLTDAARTALARKVPILRANPNVQLRIAGHADERGSVEYNLALGMRRANAVRDYLADFGIDAARIGTVSMGEDVPLDRGAGEDAWARNRRAEFTITAGGDILIMPGS